MSSMEALGNNDHQPIAGPDAPPEFVKGSLDLAIAAAQQSRMSAAERANTVERLAPMMWKYFNPGIYAKDDPVDKSYNFETIKRKLSRLPSRVLRALDAAGQPTDHAYLMRPDAKIKPADRESVILQLVEENTDAFIDSNITEPTSEQREEAQQYAYDHFKVLSDKDLLLTLYQTQYNKDVVETSRGSSKFKEWLRNSKIGSALGKTFLGIGFVGAALEGHAETPQGSFAHSEFPGLNLDNGTNFDYHTDIHIEAVNGNPEQDLAVAVAERDSLQLEWNLLNANIENEKTSSLVYSEMSKDTTNDEITRGIALDSVANKAARKGPNKLKLVELEGKIKALDAKIKVLEKKVTSQRLANVEAQKVIDSAPVPFVEMDKPARDIITEEYIKLLDKYNSNKTELEKLRNTKPLAAKKSHHQTLIEKYQAELESDSALLDDMERELVDTSEPNFESQLTILIDQYQRGQDKSNADGLSELTTEMTNLIGETVPVVAITDQVSALSVASAYAKQIAKIDVFLNLKGQFLANASMSTNGLESRKADLFKLQDAALKAGAKYSEAEDIKRGDLSAKAKRDATNQGLADDQNAKNKRDLADVHADNDEYVDESDAAFVSKRTHAADNDSLKMDLKKQKTLTKTAVEKVNTMTAIELGKTIVELQKSDEYTTDQKLQLINAQDVFNKSDKGNKALRNYQEAVQKVVLSGNAYNASSYGPNGDGFDLNSRTNVPPPTTTNKTESRTQLTEVIHFGGDQYPNSLIEAASVFQDTKGTDFHSFGHFAAHPDRQLYTYHNDAASRQHMAGVILAELQDNNSRIMPFYVAQGRQMLINSGDYAPQYVNNVSDADIRAELIRVFSDLSAGGSRYGSIRFEWKDSAAGGVQNKINNRGLFLDGSTLKCSSFTRNVRPGGELFIYSINSTGAKNYGFSSGCNGAPNIFGDLVNPIERTIVTNNNETTIEIRNTDVQYQYILANSVTQIPYGHSPRDYTRISLGGNICFTLNTNLNFGGRGGGGGIRYEDTPQPRKILRSGGKGYTPAEDNNGNGSGGGGQTRRILGSKGGGY